MELFRILREIYKMKKNTELTKEEILKIQDEKLYNLIKFALIHCDFYKELYEEKGINLKNYKTVPLEDYPIIDKKMIQDNFDRIVTDKKIRKKDLEEFISNEDNWGERYLGKYVLVTSSGSTGHPSVFIYDQKGWATVKAFIVARGNPKTYRELIKSQKAAFVGLTKGALAGITLARDMEKASYTMLLLDITKSTEENYKKINEFKPDVLSGYASSIAEYATAQLEGRIDIYPKSIICSADKLSKERRELIKRAFGIEPLDYYSASESLGIAVQVKEHKKLFVFDDYYKVELLDKSHQEVPLGQKGQVVLTNLYNYIFPLIRYEMHDYLRKSKIQENNFTTIDEVLGREEDSLEYLDGNKDKVEVHMASFVAIYLKGIEQIQYIQTTPKSLLVKYVAKDILDKELKVKVVEVLDELGLASTVEVEVNRVEHIDIDPRTGKFKSIIKYKA